MRAELRMRRGVGILDLQGELTIPRGGNVVLRNAVNEALASGVKNLLLNMEKVTKFDAAGIGELVSAYTTLDNRDGELRLLNISSKISEVLQITQLISVFRIETDENAAVASFCGLEEANPIVMFRGLRRLVPSELERCLLGKQPVLKKGKNWKFAKQAMESGLFIDLSQLEYADVATLAQVVLLVESGLRARIPVTVALPLSEERQSEREFLGTQPGENIATQLQERIARRRKVNTFLKLLEFEEALAPSHLGSSLEDLILLQQYDPSRAKSKKTKQIAGPDVRTAIRRRQQSATAKSPKNILPFTWITEDSWERVRQPMEMLFEQSDPSGGSAGGPRFEAISNAVFELVRNVSEHARFSGYALFAAQVRSSKNLDPLANYRPWIRTAVEQTNRLPNPIIEILVGDSGIGLATTLPAEHGRQAGSGSKDVSDLTKWSFLSTTTRKPSHEWISGWRQVGLIVQEYGGMVTVRTANQQSGWIYASAGSPETITDPKRLATVPGTLIHLRIPSSVPEGNRFERMVQVIRRSVLQSDYANARRTLVELAREHPGHSGRIRNELGFLFDLDVDPEIDSKRWLARAAQIDWRKKVWAALTTEVKARKRPKKDAAAEDPSSVPKTELVISQERAVHRTRGDPAAQGEALEAATLDLLRLLFKFETADEQRILDHLSQQPRGTQLGFDVKATYCWARSDRQVRCLIECKSQKRDITLADIADKLLDAEAFQSRLDHWILIAPRAGISATLKSHLDRWDDEARYSFRVQVWSRDAEVCQLFGLFPALYYAWCGEDVEGDPPEMWSAEKRRRIAQHWHRKLDAVVRLPKGWSDYVKDPRHLIIYSDLPHESLAAIASSYIQPRGVDQSGAPLPDSLLETAREWLSSSTRVLLILGDFGDGKTVFTYLFCRQILEEFSPGTGWIPVRFSLRDFSRPGVRDGRDFLRRRLEEFGADVSGWKSLTNQHKILIVLDGMDEMSKALDAHSVKDTINKLIDCIAVEFDGMKVILTCRTPFFEALLERDYILSRLEAPLVVYLRNFDRGTVANRLARQAVTQAQKRRLNVLRGMHDPIGLATKPLFFEMISETLWDSDEGSISEVGLYDRYIHKSLERKWDDLEPDKIDVPKNSLIQNMLEILELVALEIHTERKEYASLKSLSASKRRPEYARWLWESAGTSSSIEMDARSRVGVRSLLRRVAVADSRVRESWPVDFCHRSMREYFIARKLSVLIIESANRARALLSRSDLSYETIRFAAALMRSRDEAHPALRWLAEQSRAPKSDEESAGTLTNEERTRLGRSSIMLLYLTEGGLREDDWSHMFLDGASLAGIDLRGKDFSGTSLRNANLDNARLTGADFSNADLTGVRLEETTRVSALAVAESAEYFVALYSDGNVRRWDLGTPTPIASPSIFHSSLKASSSVDIVVLPGSNFCFFQDGEVVFADLEDGVYKEVARFPAVAGTSKVSFRARSMLTVQEISSGDYTARVFGFGPDGVTSAQTKALGSCWLCDLVSARVLVMAEVGGRTVVRFLDTGQGSDVEISETNRASVVVGHGPINEDSRVFLVACGEQDGFLGVWRLELSDQGPTLQKMFRKKQHDGAVTSVGFVEDHSLLSGGKDKMIHLIDIETGRQVRSFSLKLEVEGMKIDGLKGEKERELLLQLI